VDLFASQEVKWIGRPGYADRICVLNEHVRSFLIKSGRSADQVVVTGNPAFERHFTADARSGGKALKHRFGWSDDRRTILWASQPEPAVHPFSGRTGDPSLPRRIETTLRQFVAAHDGWRLVIRYHPSEQIAFVPAPNVDFSSPGDRLEYLLNAVDLVIVTASTVGLEAAILGLPVLSLDCSVSTPDTLFSERGVSIGVGTVAELPGAIVEQGMKMDGEHSGEAKAAFLMPDHPAQAILAQVEGLIAR
jgi:CDP-glycerol glycerophosphotransferase (TagB/SpsB family)